MTTQDFVHLIQTHHALPEPWITVMEHGFQPETALRMAIYHCHPQDVFTTTRLLGLTWAVGNEQVNQRAGAINPLRSFVKKRVDRQMQTDIDCLARILAVFQETVDDMRSGGFAPPHWQAYLAEYFGDDVY